MKQEVIKLPGPNFDGGISLERALQMRTSERTYLDRPLTQAEIGQVLWAAQGLTGSGQRRTIPSAGALYPLEVYLVAGKVGGLEPGVYKYALHGHELRMTLAGDKRGMMFRVALQQSCITSAPANIVICAVYERTTSKYKERGVRYVYMEAGHAAQNIYLQAAALNMKTVAIGAFNDQDLQQVLKLERDESPLYIMPIAH